MIALSEIILALISPNEAISLAIFFKEDLSEICNSLLTSLTPLVDQANFVNSILSWGFFTLPVNKTDPLLTKTLESAIKFLSSLKIKLEIFVFIMLSFMVVPIPFSLEWAPKETIPTVPTIGAQDWKTKSQKGKTWSNCRSKKRRSKKKI